MRSVFGGLGSLFRLLAHCNFGSGFRVATLLRLTFLRLFFGHGDCHWRCLGYGFLARDDQMPKHGIVKAERAPDLFDHRNTTLNVQQNVMRFVDFVDRMGQLAAAPVFGAVHHTAGTGHHALVSLDHGRDLFALVRMDQEHDFIMSHRLPFWLKTGRIACRNARLPLRIAATRLPGAARGFPPHVLRRGNIDGVR